MHPARRLVTLIVGLIFLASLHTCLALPASSLSSLARDTESSSVVPPSTSKWDTYNETSGLYSLYETNGVPGALSKRDQYPYFLADNSSNKNEWAISSWPDQERVGILSQSLVHVGSGSNGEVWAAIWKPTDPCLDRESVVVKISKYWLSYHASSIIQGFKNQHVVKVIKAAWADKYDLSVVAFEKLGKSATDAINAKEPLGKAFHQGVMQGVLAGVKKGFFNMDLKFDNVLFKGVWKIIDWDLFVEGGPNDKQTGIKSTYTFMSPEMVGHELKIPKKVLGFVPKEMFPGWKAGPTQVFIISLMFLYERQNMQYEGVITQEMRTLKTTLLDNIEKKYFGGELEGDNHSYWWHWVALLVAHFKQKASPEEILNVLPARYRHGTLLEKAWGEWFSRTLCNPQKRYTLEQAIAAYDRLKLE